MDILNKKDHVVIDNIINKKLQNKIIKTLMGVQFPWYVTSKNIGFKKFFTSNTKNYITDKYKYKNIIEGPQLTHTFATVINGNVIINSNHYNLIKEICVEVVKYFKLNDIIMYRCKANLLQGNMKYVKNSHNTPHTDFDLDLIKKNNIITAIYYVNNSDGDTFFFKKNNVYKKITPKKGRFLFFRGSMPHASSNPLENEVRCVINFNIGIK